MDFKTKIYINTVIGIRTYKISNAELEPYNQLISYFRKEDIYFVVDATSYTQDEIETIVAQNENIIFFTNEKLTQLDLKSDIPRVGWRCGDYFYYYLKMNVQAEYYWCKPPQKLYRLKQNNSDKINQENSCERVSLQRDRLLVA